MKDNIKIYVEEMELKDVCYIYVIHGRVRYLAVVDTVMYHRV